MEAEGLLTDKAGEDADTPKKKKAKVYAPSTQELWVAAASTADELGQCPLHFTIQGTPVDSSADALISYTPPDPLPEFYRQPETPKNRNYGTHNTAKR